MKLRDHALSTLLVAAALLAGCDRFVSIEDRVQRAEALIGASDYRGAIIELKNALQAEENHAHARLLLAQASLQLGDAAAADKEIRRAVAAGAPLDEVAPVAAEVHVALGHSRELYDQLTAGQLKLEEPARSIYLGKALLGLRRIDEASSAFQNALSVTPNSRPARLGLAEVDAAEGRLQDARSRLDDIIAAEPDAADALLARGILDLRRGQIALAVESLSAARKGSSQLPFRQQAALLAALGDAQLARGDTNAARDVLKDLDSMAHEAAVTRMLSARIALADREYQKASAELQKVVASAPTLVEARFLLGAALAAQGSLGQAELQLKQAVDQAPENIEARQVLAQVRLQLQRPEAAIEALQGDLQNTVPNAKSEALLGFAHLQLGDSTRGLELLKRSVQDNPSDRARRLDLAAAYLRLGSAAEAREVLRPLEYRAGDVRRERLIIAAVWSADGVGAARAEVERFLKEHDQDAQLLALASGFFGAQREYERARSLSDQALALRPSDASISIQRAQLELNAGERGAADDWLKRALAVDAGSLPALMLRADLAEARKDFQSAAKLLEEAQRRNPSAIEVQLKLARAYLLSGRNDEAEALLKPVLSATEPRADVLNAAGGVFMEAKRYERALELFRSAAGVSPDTPAYWFNVARAQLALGYDSAARESLEHCLTVQPRWAPAVAALTVLDVRAGRAPQALVRISKLRGDRAADDWLWLLEGDIHMAEKRFARAEETYSAALKVQPSAQAAMRSFQARRLGSLALPLEPLEAWLKRTPEDVAIRAVLAEAHQAAGRREQAIEQYEFIAAKQPLHAGVLNNLAWLYQEQGDARALSVAERAYKAAPESPEVLDTYGWILFKHGNLERALPLLRQSSTHANGVADIDYHYAAALAAKGEAEVAKELLRKALERPGPFHARADAEKLLAQLPSS